MIKVKEKLEKGKGFWKEEGIKLMYYGLGIAAGTASMLLYHKYSNARVDNGMRMLSDKGYLIFTKPTEDGSIPKIKPDEWCKMIGKIDWRNEV